jgi:hypothetical protein
MFKHGSTGIYASLFAQVGHEFGGDPAKDPRFQEQVAQSAPPAPTGVVGPHAGSAPGYPALAPAAD